MKGSEQGQIPLPQAKPVPETWAQRVAANGKPYFQDPVSRQITWNDPVSMPSCIVVVVVVWMSRLLAFGSLILITDC